ncbi:hypothetical protein GCM10007390_51270 [Persicitalea jodogahamensis]|uniref:Uncharacterized protein n=2 Tax=Persicitalea jodogahamensis TaxID=402147 RepID=A0A8J3DCF9_9BACT|nr:hypothetical protein GCM10007390_51270 [Persicitalea jodogahamensis]
MMVIPADDLLKRLNCLTEQNVQGQTMYVRNYQKAYIDQIDLRFVSGAIAGKFEKAGFPPLEDFEQALKTAQDDAIRDDIREVQTDAITQVINQVRPDVILELSYILQKGGMTNRLTFSLVAKDSYTSKVIATIANPGMQTAETDVPTLLVEQVENNLKNFTDAIVRHAADVRKNGRTIRLLVSVDGNADFDLEDDCGTTGEQFIDIIMNSVEAHRKKDSETPNGGNTTTGKRMQISNIRIDYVDPVKNRGISARDWVRDVAKEVEKACKVKVKNVSQGIGEGRIILGN